MWMETLFQAGSRVSPAHTNELKHVLLTSTNTEK